jgi:hypothetical protein
MDELKEAIKAINTGKSEEFESSVKIWVVRGLCQIMKVFVPAFKYIVAFI